MITKMYDGDILCGSTENLQDFSKRSKVLLDHMLFVEDLRHVFAHDDGHFRGGNTAQAVQAVPASATTHGGHHGGQHLRLWTLGYIGV